MVPAFPQIFRSFYRQYLSKMALRRSLMNMAERADVQPALKKVNYILLLAKIRYPKWPWHCIILTASADKYLFIILSNKSTYLYSCCNFQLWKKHYKVDGQVTQHLSPFEQSILGPLFKNLIPNTIKRIKNFVLVAGPGLGSGAFAYYYCEWKYKDLAYHHRS